MYPNFHLYFSILGGSWHPGLPLFREPARFEGLLQAVHPGEGCRCSTFFSQVAAFFGEALLPACRESRREALRLAALCGCGGSNVFLNLPACGAREHFYNLLTGYCLDSYGQWITRVLREHSGSETGKWIHYRLARRLRDLLALPVAPADLPTELLLILCRTQAATAILLQGLNNAVPFGKEGRPPFLWPREELKTALAACDLALPARREVLSLYDSATGCAHLPAPRPDGFTAAAAAPAATNARQLPGDDLLGRLMQESENDPKPLRLQLREFIEKHKRQPEADDTGPDARITSARACTMMGISRKAFHRLCKKHHIPFINVGGKYFFRPADIRQLILERSNKEKPGNGN